MSDLVSCRYLTKLRTRQPSHTFCTLLRNQVLNIDMAATYPKEEEEDYRQYRSVESLIVMRVTICCLVILQGKPC